MKKVFVLIVLIILAIGIYSFSKKKSPTFDKTVSSSSNNSQEAVNVFAKGLEVPWALVFLPNGRLLVTERKGMVKLVTADGQLQDTPILAIPDVKQTGESGLHGITLHPDFKNNQKAYLYYTYSSDGDKSLNKVVSYKFEDGKLTEPQMIVENIPGAVFHDGGRIKFGPDGYLYITTGDALNPSFAQDKNSLAGKILRVTDEGKPVSGNPFGNEVFSFGHRNPQGIACDADGNLWETEHGQSAQDEVNLIKKSENYGWPDVRGSQTKEGISSPIIQNGSDTWAPAGLAYLDGSLFFAGLRGQTLFEGKINGEKLNLIKHFEKEFGRIRDVIVGPDKMLYISTSNRDGRGQPAEDDDKIIRIDPAKL